MKPLTISLVIIIVLTVIGGMLYSQSKPGANKEIIPTSSELFDIASPTPTPTQLPSSEVTLYLVSLEGEDEGAEIGCGDTLVPLSKSVRTTDPLQTSLELLISEDHESLYNALHGSDLVIDNIMKSDNATNVYLSGELTLGGVCDNPRVEEQLRNTITANSNSNSIYIYVNDVLLEDILSLEN